LIRLPYQSLFWCLKIGIWQSTNPKRVLANPAPHLAINRHLTRTPTQKSDAVRKGNTFLASRPVKIKKAGLLAGLLIEAEKIKPYLLSGLYSNFCPPIDASAIMPAFGIVKTTTPSL
jgi:hypothetical protein